MKEEDTDWLVYHIIAREQAICLADLEKASGLSAPVLGESVARLEQAHLVGRVNDTVRVLSFGESLILNQMKYSADLPLYMENGVIRGKK